MARSNIPMVINLRQNTNDDSTAYGKYFAEVELIVYYLGEP